MTRINEVSINDIITAKFALVINDVLKDIKIDEFTDERYYPPANAEEELTLRYFITMVAIDHRTSRFTNFEGYVDGEFYHGADLLYRLGAKRLTVNPHFFDPENLAKITASDVIEWLSVKYRDNWIRIWDPDVRAELLRDLGIKIMKFFNGRVLNIIRKSSNYLRNPLSAGLINLLKIFKAYSDPVEKKSYLLVKFLTRRGLLRPRDPENLEVPVDNHLVRIALRIGLISIPQGMLIRIKSRKEFKESEDIIIRSKVREAYKRAARIASINPLIMDDFLWTFGRRVCTRENPACISGNNCPFKELCLHKGRPAKEIIEHNFQDTYYY